MSEQDDAWLIKGLRDGDPDAVRTFCERYGPKLQQVADRHLAAGLKRRVGPESVCQSVCLSFLRRAQAGEYQLADAEDLWRLLCAITLTKVREKARYHTRQKRSIGRERALNAPAGSEADGIDPADYRESPVEAMEFQEHFELLVKDFSEVEQQLLELRLQQCTNEEIASRLRCSERTVRRTLGRMKERLQQSFGSDS